MTEGARIGYYIRSLRKRSGLTQEAVANALSISQSYLRRIEHGKANPTVNKAYEIIHYLEAVSDVTCKDGRKNDKHSLALPNDTEDHAFV